MTEVDISGMNAIAFPQLATWHWHVALYLFAGGLVAGLMIFGSSFRLINMKGFEKAVWISDMVGLPLLGIGMLFLWFDLARRWNAWRFFTTLQITSPMSWGSWILLISILLLGLRFLTYLPAPAAETSKHRLVRTGRALWRFGFSVGQKARHWTKPLDILTILFGVALGLYTGVLLNTIPARPLWNSSILPILFLVSGLASGWAFLCLFIAGEQIRKLMPLSIAIGGIELFLILSYVLTLVSGTEATQRAGELFLSGAYGLGLWGLVVLVGLLVPVTIETMEVTRRHVPVLLTRSVPLMTLIGGVALRFVIVYAGLHSYI